MRFDIYEYPEIVTWLESECFDIEGYNGEGVNAEDAFSMLVSHLRLSIVQSDTTDFLRVVDLCIAYRDAEYLLETIRRYNCRTFNVVRVMCGEHRLEEIEIYPHHFNGAVTGDSFREAVETVIRAHEYSYLRDHPYAVEWHWNLESKEVKASGAVEAKTSKQRNMPDVSKSNLFG